MVNRSEVEREIWADELLDRLTPVMSALSVVFVLVVIGESLATSGTTSASADERSGCSGP